MSQGTTEIKERFGGRIITVTFKSSSFQGNSHEALVASEQFADYLRDCKVARFPNKIKGHEREHAMADKGGKGRFIVKFSLIMVGGQTAIKALCGYGCEGFRTPSQIRDSLLAPRCPSKSDIKKAQFPRTEILSFLSRFR